MRSGFRRSCSSRRQSTPSGVITRRSCGVSRPSGLSPGPSWTRCFGSGRDSATIVARIICTPRRGLWSSVTADVCRARRRAFSHCPESGDRPRGPFCPWPTTGRPSFSTPTCAVFSSVTGEKLFDGGETSSGRCGNLRPGFFRRPGDDPTRRDSWILEPSFVGPGLRFALAVPW